MTQQKTEVAVLAGGCFWCIEAPLREIRGIISLEPGYAGGHVPDPTYEEVCTGRTGHAEVVRIEFDPDILSYRDLLGMFFVLHDPTTLNRQGNDVGTQYRSAIFTLDDEQARIARQVCDELTAARTWPDPIVTQIVPLEHFYPAETYHQDYFAKNPGNPFCNAVIPPKIAKIRKLFRERLASP
ncbi:peptide-methionine (S)-S-oxide reductase MsrA [Novacetimonas cocois]|uniref:Peptide methionine sulfoxide reductase MsrA n=1 Tax=Novacetimonas cocois TaxID=1747507 RepID=A0A365Z280_9PROT|nr:peptide-methionine (S)-S-oxide reductase MsrA [Novacetimonas cocois]RBM09173.1 peptide-methionine (S)-S-oxide reductase [Novacetimonas cocois]